MQIQASLSMQRRGSASTRSPMRSSRGEEEEIRGVRTGSEFTEGVVGVARGLLQLEEPPGVVHQVLLVLRVHGVHLPVLAALVKQRAQEELGKPADRGGGGGRRRRRGVRKGRPLLRLSAKQPRRVCCSSAAAALHQLSQHEQSRLEKSSGEVQPGRLLLLLSAAYSTVGIRGESAWNCHANPGAASLNYNKRLQRARSFQTPPPSPQSSILNDRLRCPDGLRHSAARRNN